MKPQRYELAAKAWEMHHKRGMTITETAFALGCVTDSGMPRRGKVQRMIQDYGRDMAQNLAETGISGVFTDNSYDALLNELKAARTQIAALHQQLNEQEDEALYGHNLGKPWELAGDFVIVGDVHVSTTNWKFAQRPLQIAMKYLTKPRRLIIAGDLINADSWSKYDSAIPLPSFGAELKAARHFIDKYLEVFDEIYLFLGNHDRRVQLRTNSAIAPEDLLRMISHDTRVKISHWGHCVINTPKGKWRALHGSEFSVNQLVIADQLSQKYGMHIIGHHQHHLSVGWNRFKQFVIVDNGGLFDQDSMAYTVLDDNKRPRMANGFTLLRSGTPYLFGTEPFTDYDYWLGEKSNIIQLEDVA